MLKDDLNSLCIHINEENCLTQDSDGYNVLQLN